MEAILIIGIIQSLFGSIMVFSTRKNHVANKLLSYWLIAIAAIMIEAILKENNIGQFRNSLQSGSVVFIYGPLLFLYTKNLLSEVPKIEKRDLLHFIPFLIFAFLSLIYNKETIRLSSYWFINDEFLWLRILFSVSCILSLSLYTIIIAALIKKHYLNIKNHFSFNSERINLLWLAILAVFFTIGYLTTFFSIFFQAKSQISSNTPLLIYYGVLTLFSYCVSMFGYKQPVLFKKYPDPLSKQNYEGTPHKRYEKSGLKDEEAKIYLTKIIEYMSKEKPYLKGDLTINELAHLVDIPKHYITQIINEQLGKNFYNFINEYRVEEFKNKISNKEYLNYTLLGIALECGFNSKSSFNSIFKQLTGKTPTQFKKELN